MKITYALSSAFSYRDGDVWKERTLDEVLAILSSGKDPKAHDWLKAYLDEHIVPAVPGDSGH